jgi:hypothetical protein
MWNKKLPLILTLLIVKILSLRKLYFILILTSFFVGCEDLSSKAARKEYIIENKKHLEFAVEKLLKKEWDTFEAQRFLTRQGIELGINEVRIEDEVVSFMIDGILDNCIGIAYSRLGKEAHICGGNTMDWELLLRNWYFLNSI